MWIVYIGIAAATFLLMEFVAWFAHKYVMHGFLWFLHEDHHTKESQHTSIDPFEKNDAFFLIFAIPGIICLVFGISVPIPLIVPIGIGITLYGAAYFFVHDLFIHQRIKVLRNTKNKYLKAIRRAHKVHHKHLGKEHGECFGMLWVPRKYYS